MDEDPIRRQLDSGEDLLWSGQPRRGVRATIEEQDLGFLIGFIGFFVFWFSIIICTTLRNSRDVEGHLDVGSLTVGACFCIFGLVFLSLALRQGAISRPHVHYGLTDRRIVHITGVLPPTVRSYPLDHLERIDVSIHGNGRGTVTFLDATYPTANGQTGILSFEQIDNVQSVYDLIRAAQERREGR
jgi:hypothetical protein